jgi:hypothetical protein
MNHIEYQIKIKIQLIKCKINQVRQVFYQRIEEVDQ